MPRLETFTTEAFRRVATAASGVMTTEVPISILGSALRSAMLLVLIMVNESTFASQTAASYSKMATCAENQNDQGSNQERIGNRT